MNTHTCNINGFKLAITLLILVLPQVARADMIGVYAGAGVWNNSTTGKMTHNGTSADMEKEYGYEKDYGNFSYLAVEHPFPFIPNARINRLSLATSSNTTLTAANAFTFAGTNYTAGTAIKSEMKWDEEDALLYYEFLDNIVSFDLGVGLKSVKAEFSVTAGGVTNSLKFEEDLPFVYSMLGAHIPGTGISFIIEQISTFAGDMEITQNSTRLSYEIGYMLGVEAGYKTSTANLDGLPGVAGELEFAGPFINLLFHF